MQLPANVNDPSYLKMVAEKAPALIYVFNQETGENEYTNRQISDVLGYSVDEVRQLGLDLMATALHPDDAAEVFAHIETLKDLPDGAAREIEYRMQHKDGHWVTLMSSDSVFRRDETGAVTHHIGIVIDVSAAQLAA